MKRVEVLIVLAAVLSMQVKASSFPKTSGFKSKEVARLAFEGLESALNSGVSGWP